MSPHLWSSRLLTQNLTCGNSLTCNPKPDFNGLHAGIAEVYRILKGLEKGVACNCSTKNAKMTWNTNKECKDY